MRAFVLQDWVTIRGGTTVTSIIQMEANYAQMDAFQDVVFWLQVSENTTSGGTVTMNYETAPIKDESLFTAMGTKAINGAAMTPAITSVIAATATTPVARWVRWRLVGSGTFTAAWDVTFRLLLVANQQVVFPTPQ
jgi:hypothetical protein